MSFISDTYTEAELSGRTEGDASAWAADVGRRLEYVAVSIGKDKSVQMTERSWKQLQRYFGGADVPARVVTVLSSASGASSEYILNGNIINSYDCDIERRIIDKKIKILAGLNFDNIEMIRNSLLLKSKELAVKSADIMEKSGIELSDDVTEGLRTFVRDHNLADISGKSGQGIDLYGFKPSHAPSESLGRVQPRLQGKHGRDPDICVRGRDVIALTEIAASATMSWLDANRLDLGRDFLARLISKALQALLDHADPLPGDLRQYVFKTLDDGLELLRSRQ